MLRFRMLQANEGDCLLVLHDGDAVATRVLIDGGMSSIYKEHLRPVLSELADAGDALDLVVLSHVDSDHTRGLVKLLAELRDQRDEGEAPLIAVRGLWHNAFSETEDDGTVIPRLRALHALAGSASVSAASALSTIAEGSQLRGLARDLRIPRNQVRNGSSLLAGKPVSPVTVGGLTITVVGPTKENLDALRAEWKTWLDELEAAPAGVSAATLDTKAPNLSSIQLLVEADGRRILLTGDGRGDHLLDALASLDLLDADGKIHVDLLKLPHHGSNRNVPPDFFERVTADCYAVSANGRYGNPDRSTLDLLLQSARSAGRRFTLAATNHAPDLDAFLADNPPGLSGYDLMLRDDGDHFIEIALG